MRSPGSTSLVLFALGVILGFADEAGAESAGLNVELVAEMRRGGDTSLRAGEPLRIGFRITNQSGRFPLGDLHPGAWIRKASDGRSTCRQAVQDYLRRGVNVGADIDLNGYAFVTLNEDHTLAVVDPRLDLATSNLLSLTRLEAEAADWHLDDASGRLILALPEENRLAVVDLFRGQLVANWPTAEGPARLAAFPDQDDLWVAAFASGSLQRLDKATGEVLGSIDLEAGLIGLALDLADQRLFALDQVGRLLIIDGLNGAIMADHQIGIGGEAIVYSRKADALVIAGGDQQALRLLYLDHEATPLTIQMPARADQIVADHSGRWLFALDVEAGRLSIVDLAINRATHALDFTGKPDRMTITDDYLYLRETEAARVSILHQGSLSSDAMPGVLDVAIGAKPVGPTDLATPLPTIAPLPEGGGALIAHPVDKTLYLYRETGMQAPSNAFKSWTAAPEAVLIHDQSLKEEAAGLYETTALVQEPGAYEVVFHLASPAHVACYPISVEGDIGRLASDGTTGQSLLITPAVKGLLDDGEPIAITFQVSYASSRKPVVGLRDLRILIVDRSKGWHWQGFAEPLDKAGDYSVMLEPPGPGAYTLFARSKRAGLTFEDDHRLQVMLE
ncbi:MAG: YncE family protein [Geminicoccaceae bacterium]